MPIKKLNDTRNVAAAHVRHSKAWIRSRHQYLVGDVPFLGGLIEGHVTLRSLTQGR